MNDAPELLAVGAIRRAHGVRGEVVVELMTDAPDAIFAAGRRVFVGTPDGRPWRDDLHGDDRAIAITGVRPFQDGLLVTFDAITDRNTAALWRGRTLLVPRDELAPPEADEFYEHELDGLAVFNTAGERIGDVSAWYRLPHCLLFDVTTPRGVVSVPYNERFVLRVDRAARALTMDIPDDLYPSANVSAPDDRASTGD